MGSFPDFKLNSKFAKFFIRRLSKKFLHLGVLIGFTGEVFAKMNLFFKTNNKKEQESSAPSA
jgi:hypothetical protein